MADNTKEIAELESRARALRDSFNDKYAHEVGELSARHRSLVRQAAASEKELAGARRDVQAELEEASSWEKDAIKLDAQAKDVGYKDPKKAESLREEAENARIQAQIHERTAQVAREDAGRLEKEHAALVVQRDETRQDSTDRAVELIGGEMEIDDMETRAVALRKVDNHTGEAERLEALAASWTGNAKHLKNIQTQAAQHRTDASKAQVEADKVQIDEAMITRARFDEPATTAAVEPDPRNAAPTGADESATAGLLDAEADVLAAAAADGDSSAGGSVASDASAGGDVAAATGTASAGADDVVGAASVDSAVASASSDSVDATEDSAGDTVDAVTDSAFTPPLTPATPPTPYPNTTEDLDAAAAMAQPDVEMTDASALVADDGGGDVSSDLGPTDDATAVVDAGLDSPEA